MENFIVSARKYRPQAFDTVIGQTTITQTLKNAIRGQSLAQAFLFCGPRGVGKTTCARILAKTINCFNLSENLEACNQCESCISFNNSASFNIIELDAASNNSVDDIRNLVEQVRIPPQVGRYKVYIIDEVHMLSPSAFNAFLKTLEEPPAYAKFILATTEKHKIIPTILSRCQIYDFKRITVEDIARQLSFVADKENILAEQDALHIIAQKSDGAMRDALSIFDQIVSFSGKKITYKNVIENLNVLDYDYYFRIIESILAGDMVTTLLIINEIIDNGFDGQHFIIGFGEHIRNLLVGKDTKTVSLLEVGGSIRDRYLAQSRACQADFLLKLLDLNNKCDIDYRNSNNKKLHLEITLMKMCALNRTGVSYEKSQAVVAEQTGKISYQSKTANIPERPAEADNKPAGTGTSKSLAAEIISIKPGNHQEKKIREDIADSSHEKPSEPVSHQSLIDIWKKLSENFKTDKNLYYTLSNKTPELRDEQLITFIVDNKIQKQELEDRKAEIMAFVREGLKNYKLQLEVKVSGTSSRAKPYSPKEKFNEMVKKNPALQTLKDQLNLEIDF
ncbi:MAG: DNA polymerase III subunit gamma/tau [Bacteroidales bacterium]